ncbi:MAG: HAD family hydrolase [Candidatus Heimdallarchaeota archaeon]
MIDDTVTLEDILSKNKSTKAFLFDLDGTLIDSQEGIITIVKDFLDSKGYNFSKKSLESLFGKPIEELFREVLIEKSNEEIWEYVKEIRKIYAKNHLQITELFPKVTELLESIKATGLKIGIASTKFKRFIIEVTDHFEITKFFDVIVSGYEVDNHKPAPDIIYKSAELLQILPSECIYVGDSISDVEAGNTAGATTIAVLTGTSKLDKIIAAKPDFIVKELTSIRIKKRG